VSPAFAESLISSARQGVSSSQPLISVPHSHRIHSPLRTARGMTHTRYQRPQSHLWMYSRIRFACEWRTGVVCPSRNVRQEPELSPVTVHRVYGLLVLLSPLDYTQPFWQRIPLLQGFARERISRSVRVSELSDLLFGNVNQCRKAPTLRSLSIGPCLQPCSFS